MKYMRRNASNKHVEVKSMDVKHTAESINKDGVKRQSDMRKTCVDEKKKNRNTKPIGEG